MKKKNAKFTSCRNVIDTIEKLKEKRITNKVLHGHPSPVFWNHSISIEEFLIKRQNDLLVNPKDLVVYIALPFCMKTNPPDCGYCLFPHITYTNTDELKKYLKFLKLEGEVYRPFFHNDRISAVYFGGGTPNIYKEEYYKEILNLFALQFRGFNDDIEITFEGIPWLFTKNKLIELKKNGVNRISLGVQQLNSELLKKSGRIQDPAHVVNLINWCHELNLKVSADMIYGWPGQTVESLLKDLEILTSTRISHLTNYELNLAGRTDFSRNRRHELPGSGENLIMCLALKQFLEDHGYTQVSTNDFARTEENTSNIFRFEMSMRKFWDVGSERKGNDMWGWGFGGISYFLGTPDDPGSVIMNTTDLTGYYRDISMHKPPIKRVYNYTREDIRIGWIFQALQNLQVERNTYRQLFGSDILDDHKPIWQALYRLGWMEITDHRMILVREGIYYTPLIQSLISAARLDEIREEQRP